MTWHPGQQAVIGRQLIVTIERVTPSGRAIVGTQRFDRDGRELGTGDSYNRVRMEPLTPEISAEMELVTRGRAAAGSAYQALTDADLWLRQNFSSWGRRVPEAADVEKAERLVSAIREVMKETP